MEKTTKNKETAVMKAYHFMGKRPKGYEWVVESNKEKAPEKFEIKITLVKEEEKK